MSALAPVRVAARAALRSPSSAAAGAPARTARQAARPSLRVVAAPRLTPGRLPFALLVAGILGSGLVALLMLHTLAAQDAFTLHHLQRQSATLGDAEQQLTVAGQQAQAPSALAGRARALGMVPAGSLQIVRRHDGRIVAVTTAVAVPAPRPAATPTPASKTKPATGPAARPAGAASPARAAHPAKPAHHPKPRSPH